MGFSLLSLLTGAKDPVLAILPLIPVAVFLLPLLGNPLQTIQNWIRHWTEPPPPEIVVQPPSVSSQLLAYVTLAIGGYFATHRLIPNLAHYTLRKGICGKDLGKRGTPAGEQPIPEALGIVTGTVFLVCLILCLVGLKASNPTKLLDVNAALLSICFMLFLGFTDDVLDWPWRYKLILPTVASLPLLCSYSGSTSIVVPVPIRPFLFHQGTWTALGRLLNWIVSIDAPSEGAVMETGWLYMIYMGLLAVFCTNAINIYAGVNGLEAGQAYIIGCAILIHNLVEIQSCDNNPILCHNHLFSVMLILSFVGVTLALLQHNWYPARVFVGDTFCYQAGVTFAVVGILGHFSKTLLLFFIPQILNFLWSCPQLFKFVPCPRHRLPTFNPTTGLCQPSTFPCQANEYTWLKTNRNDTECPNMTLICLCLQYLGPMTERNLCITLLTFQAISCIFGFVVRYYVSQFFFDQ